MIARLLGKNPSDFAPYAFLAYPPAVYGNLAFCTCSREEHTHIANAPLAFESSWVRLAGAWAESPVCFHHTCWEHTRVDRASNSADFCFRLLAAATATASGLASSATTSSRAFRLYTRAACSQAQRFHCFESRSSSGSACFRLFALIAPRSSACSCSRSRAADNCRQSCCSVLGLHMSTFGSAACGSCCNRRQPVMASCCT